MKSIIILPVVILGIFLNANAQKVPNKQEISILAPSNIKIDGKAIEWNNIFKAYNHATDIFYTLSNDDNNLYLIVHAENRVVTNKIINGGITFSVYLPGKNDKSGASITYPVFERNSKPSLSINTKTAIEQGASAPVSLPDSVIALNNINLANKSKFIMVTGIKGIDTLISVYNENGIKIAQLFDNKMAYTYELAIPLKLLNLSIAESAKFAYHITLNGASILKSVAKGGNTISTDAASSDLLDAKKNAESLMLGQTTAPTDFGGEYTLAKKQ